MIYVVGMAPLMMHHAYTNYGGGGSGNIQQMQGLPQQLHLQQQQLQQHWNNHTTQKRSKYYKKKLQQNFKHCQKKKKNCPSIEIISLSLSLESFEKERSHFSMFIFNPHFFSFQLSFFKNRYHFPSIFVFDF